jgi:hypothetical protein
MNPSQGQESGMAEIEPTTPESSGNLLIFAFSK